MVHVSIAEILKNTKKERFGIPCLAGSTLEMIIGIIKAAEDTNSPVIICYNKQLSPEIPIEISMPLIVNAAERSRIPIATILDHGSDFDLIIKAIHYGSSSVMFDGSGLPFKENIIKTKEVVKVAHALNVSVEAELGGVGGSALEATMTSSMESIFTDLNEVQEFVESTGVDALAISFGNAHGRYMGEPKLDLELVKKISQSVDLPLVMHGASGLTLETYKLIVESGISKINYFSAMCRGIYEKMKNFLESVGEDAFCINTIPMSINYWYEETSTLLEALNCKGKANITYRSFDGKTGQLNDFVGIISEAVYKEIYYKLKK